MVSGTGTGNGVRGSRRPIYQTQCVARVLSPRGSGIRLSFQVFVFAVAVAGASRWRDWKLGEVKDGAAIGLLRGLGTGGSVRQRKGTWLRLGLRMPRKREVGSYAWLFCTRYCIFALCKLMFPLIGYYPLFLYLNTPFLLDLSLFCLNMRALVSSKGLA